MIRALIPVTGRLPHELRAMTPRDVVLLASAHEAVAAARRPGASAPSRESVADLVKKYG